MGIVKDLCWAVFKERMHKNSKQESPKPTVDKAKSAVGISNGFSIKDNCHPPVVLSGQPTSVTGKWIIGNFYSWEDIRLAKLIMEEYNLVENSGNNLTWQNVTDFTRKHWLDYTLAVKRVMAREENRDGWSNK
jgi:hypothetical protein